MASTHTRTELHEAAPGDPQVASIDALRARLRRHGQVLAHLASDLPIDLTPEQLVLVERAVDDLSRVITQAATAAGLQRTPRGTVVTGTTEPVLFVGAHTVLGGER